MTKAVLVVDEDEDATSLVQACFDKRLPVAVDFTRNDPSVPRIETESREIVGLEAIQEYLETTT
jgi:Ni,Fe-hydrogenase III component G